METLQAERRAARLAAPTEQAAGNLSDAVRRAILLQPCIGTAGAVEYLKAHRVDGRVISRVLSGGSVRESDCAAPESGRQAPD